MLRFDVRALTPEMGVVVALVRRDRPAAEPGLRVGDIVREINQAPIRTMADFERLVDGVKPGDWLALLVQRGQAAVYVAVEARDPAIFANPARVAHETATRGCRHRRRGLSRDERGPPGGRQGRRARA